MVSILNLCGTLNLWNLIRRLKCNLIIDSVVTSSLNSILSLRNNSYLVSSKYFCLVVTSYSLRGLLQRLQISFFHIIP